MNGYDQNMGKKIILLRDSLLKELESHTIIRPKKEESNIYRQCKYNTIYDESLNEYPAGSNMYDCLDRVMFFDIETKASKMSDHENPGKFSITAISCLFSNSKIQRVLLNSEFFKDINISKLAEAGLSVSIRSEKSIIEEFVMLSHIYDCVCGYNVNQFDLKCITYKCKQYSIPSQSYVMKITGRGKKGGDYSTAYWNESISLDLYCFFKNPAIRSNAFRDSPYSDLKLNSVSKAIIGMSKNDVKFNEFNEEYVKYNLQDVVLCQKLFLQIKPLLNIISTVFDISYDDACNRTINSYIVNYVTSELKKRKIKFERQVSGKEYKGAYVLDSIPGISEDVDVIDFSSLYASIILTYNVSFENCCKCDHPECKNFTKSIYDFQLKCYDDDLKAGKKDLEIPQWIWFCRREKSIVANIVEQCFEKRKILKNTDQSSIEIEILGKKLILNSKTLIYNAQMLLKVISNAIYGLLGFTKSIIYCYLSASFTSGTGRFWLIKVKNFVETEKLATVLTGDTDSLFLKPKVPVEQILKECKKILIGHLKIDLDKHFKLLVLTERKKNYWGIILTEKGEFKMEIKGLQIKKTHTPAFYHIIYEKMKDIVKKYEEMKKKSIEVTNKRIIDDIFMILKHYYIGLRDRTIDPVELAVDVKKSKSVEEYDSNTEIVKLCEESRDFREKYENLLVGETFKLIRGVDRDILIETDVKISKSCIDYKTYMKNFKSAASQIDTNFYTKVVAQQSLSSFINVK